MVVLQAVVERWLAKRSEALRQEHHQSGRMKAHHLKVLARFEKLTRNKAYA